MKNKNLKKKRRVPELRFPEFSGEWEEKRLGEIVNFKKGKGITKRTLTEYGTKCILYGQLYTTYNEIITGISSYTDIDEQKLLFGNMGDILIPSSGETALDMSLASALLVDNVALGGDINILRPKNNTIDSKFLSYQINSARKIDLARIAEGVSVVHLYNDNLKDIIVVNPKDTAEQQKIGNFFYTIDKKLELQEEKIDTLKEYKKGMMQKIFSQEIRFKDDDGKDFPDWKEKRLGEVCKIRKGEQLNRKKFVENGKYYVLNGGREPSGYYNLWNTESNTISISEGGESCGYVTYNFERFWSGGHLYTLENLKESVNDKFLFQYLKKYEREIMRLRVGSGLPNIQKKDLDSFKIQIPSLLEQKKIANFLSAIDKKIELEEEKLENMKKFKKGLMQRMFV